MKNNLFVLRDGKLIRIDVAEYGSFITKGITAVEPQSNDAGYERDKIWTLVYEYNSSNAPLGFIFRETQQPWKDMSISGFKGNGLNGFFPTRGEAVADAMEFGLTVFAGDQPIALPVDFYMKPDSLRIVKSKQQ